MVNLRVVCALAAGGIAGATGRRLVVDLWSDGTASWATLLVNVAGSALLGWLVAAEARPARRTLTVAAGAGFCGSFTTFSAFSLIVAEHLDAGRAGAGVVYAAGSLGLAIVAAVAGGYLRRRFRRPVAEAAS